MYKDFHFDSPGLVHRVAGEHYVDTVEEEDAHLHGEPWKPRRRVRRRHTWVDEQIEEGTGI